MSFPKCPKITQKFTQNRQTVVMGISRELQRCLKRDRDIGRKAVLRTFAQKFSNIDCSLKILPLKDDELVMSEM